MEQAEQRDDRVSKYVIAVLGIWLVLGAAGVESQANLKLLGDASVAQNTLSLTSKSKSIGRAVHSERIRLCNKANTSFETHFVLSITNTTSSNGDGMAFLVSRYPAASAPQDSWGKWLGLYDQNTNGELSTHIVAVEFDRVKNADVNDPDDNHVGIDVNNINSYATMTMLNENANGVNLHDSENVNVWIDYEASNRSLSISISRASATEKPLVPLLAVPGIDLCTLVGEFASVGFSASTGNMSQDVHRVHSWKFLSDDISFEYPVFTSTTISQPKENNTESSPKNNQKNGSKPTVLVAVVVCSVIALVIITVVFFLFWKSKTVFGTVSDDEDNVLRDNLQQNMPAHPSELAYRDVKQATSNFNDGNVLGQGGFGTVYLGTLAGSRVAVKRISEGSKQGEKEFIAEVQIISRLSHRNLVPLRGWCCKSKELLLVYEYMPKGSLDRVLFSKSNVLDWNKRYEIVCGLASALFYLHEGYEHRVVHRDIKPSNVMLDSDYNAKLGDFGLARLMDRDRETRTTTVAGTLGYVAPEINRTGKMSTLTDVYSFGIVALEVASGRKPFDASIPSEETILVEWIWQLYQRENLLDAADSKLQGDFDHLQMTSILVLGLACSSPQPNARPTMSQVINVLRGDAPLPDLLPLEDSQYRSLQFF